MRHPTRSRPGTLVPLLALTVTGLFGFMALAIDLGVLTICRTQCQNAADAAALASCRQLNNSPNSVDNNSAAALLSANKTVKSNYLLNEQFTTANMTSIKVGTYSYNTTTQEFLADFSGVKSVSDSWAATQVTLAANQPTFFAKIFGIQSMPTGAMAVAVHRPRDIAMILDYSGSMMFGSTSAWGNIWDGVSNQGLLNPDSNWPKFGHYSRFQEYSIGSGTSSSTTPSNRQNPLQRTVPYNSIGYVFSPSNHTVESTSGPPMMFDFRFNPENISSPSTPVSATTSMWNAFHRWFQATPTDTPNLSLSLVDQGNPYMYGSFAPTVQSVSDMGGWTHRTFDWSGYNPFDTTNTSGPTPAPDFFDVQADDATTGVQYTGDRFPRKKGVICKTPTSWDTSTATGAAVNPIDFLNWASGYNYYPPSRTTSISGTGTSTRIGLGLFPSTNDYATNWSNFRDATWERYGYDLDVADYVANRGATWDPRWDWNIDTNAWVHLQPSGFTTSNVYRPKRIAANSDGTRFRGYSMGPGYWGKTFAVWPPDPRWGNPSGGAALGGSVQPQNVKSTNPIQDTNGNWICDWRKRFFLNKSGVQFTTENIDSILFPGTTGAMMNTTGFQVNYPAVLAWLTTGPQTLPPNLRAGRILYYDCIPTTVANASTDLTQAFWKGYIDFVLGVNNFSASNEMAGRETYAWPEGGTVASGGTVTGYIHGLTGISPTTDPAPYLNYFDNPNRPRAHMWFGPQTMLMYLYNRSRSSFWGAGTIREAQSWQLKAAVNSGINDIRTNHPNDWVGLSYFAYFNFSTPRAPIGQNYSLLRNSLFYPNSLLTGSNPLINDPTYEVRPYNSKLSNSLVGDIPNSNGGTDADTGMAEAYNLLSCSTSLPAASYPSRGRRGAAKIVVFETDGVPTSQGGWTLSGTGYDTYYIHSGTTTSWTGATREGIYLDNVFVNSGANANPALGIVQQICSLQSSTDQGGLSTANTPARVYPIAFGDLFTGYNGTYASLSTTQAQDSIKFLTRTAQIGNTGSWDPNYILPQSSVVTGDYPTRITNMRSTLQIIMQSGVQVTLLQ